MDVSFEPQDLPDPARPNNVLAPFWTDLDLDAGGALRVAELCDDAGMCWIVADWEAAPTFESAGAVTNSFQIWIAEGATESITYAYGPIGGPDGIGLTVGAENRDGSSGAEAAAPPVEGDDLTVVTSPAIAGGSVTITYDAVARLAGTHKIAARMTTDLMNSVARKVVFLTVE